MNTKDAVIQSYMDLVIQKNTTDVKVADICHNANISRKTFYNYFADKQEILECIFCEEIEKTMIKVLSVPKSIAMTNNLIASPFWFSRISRLEEPDFCNLEICVFALSKIARNNPVPATYAASATNNRLCFLFIFLCVVFLLVHLPSISVVALTLPVYGRKPQ